MGPLRWFVNAPETWCRMWWYYFRPSRYILCPVTS